MATPTITLTTLTLPHRPDDKARLALKVEAATMGLLREKGVTLDGSVIDSVAVTLPTVSFTVPDGSPLPSAEEIVAAVERFNYMRFRPVTTCGCALVYSYDKTIPVENQVIFPLKATSLCSYHQGKGSKNGYEAAVDENKRRNTVMRLAVTALPLFADDLEGNDPKKSSAMIATYDENRVLHVSFSGIAVGLLQKQTLQSSFDATIGVGKVIVE